MWGYGTCMGDLALLEWSRLICSNATPDTQNSVSHFRQRRVSFLRIRDAAEILSQLKGHFWDVFSVECLIGKRRPISSVGRIFRKPAHPESPSHSGRIRARNHRPIRPPINKEASSRTAGHEVHREFRTQRKPLNVAFVLRRTEEQGTSYPDAREDVTFRKMDRPPSAMGATRPARPSWRPPPCCPGLPWWDDPLRRPSCRAAS